MAEYTRYQHPTLELCRDCHGEGLKYLYREGDTLMMEPIATCQCPTCEGSGRVLVSKKTVITVVPFKTT